MLLFTFQIQSSINSQLQIVSSSRMLGFHEQEGRSGVEWSGAEQSSKGTVGSNPETLGYSSLTRIPKPSKNTIKKFIHTKNNH
ncbi:hypothetical protein Peur_013130 [Populus x canadensis]